MSIAVLGIIGLSIIDYITGKNITLSFFYLVPISLGAWGIGRKEGIFLSVASALNWAVVNEIMGGDEGLFSAYWNTGALLSFFLIFTVMISEIRALLETERALARTDFLTGALNRRAFYEAVSTEISRMKRTQRPFTIIYLDLDSFKAINDLRGHDTGDAVLCLVAKTIKNNIRSIDSVGRIGGDEFVILLPETSHGATKFIAPRIQTVLMESMQANQYPVTFSMGTLTYRTPPESVDILLKQADEMLYAVKNAGKNAIHYAEY